MNMKIHPHIVRHTFATHMINSGMNLTTIQEILRHDNVGTTLLYINMDNQSVGYEYRKYS